MIAPVRDFMISVEVPNQAFTKNIPKRKAGRYLQEINAMLY
jgi:hypothetical protein